MKFPALPFPLNMLSNSFLPLLLALLLALLLLLPGCVSRQPENTANLCDIFDEKRGWFKRASRSARYWDADIAVMMSIMYQESSFRARAKPPRKWFLWIIPGRRPASAYGYAQALDGTWDLYRNDTGRHGADRNDFGDAIDFIGWYNDQSRRKNQIRKDDAYHLYLAYHEGQGGFAKRTFKGKQWLKDVATNVSARSRTYRSQLAGCEKRLSRGFLARFFGWMFGWL